MEVEIVQRRDNPLLEREEVEVLIKNDVTPSRKDVRNAVAAKLGVNPDLTVVRYIKGKTGLRMFRARIHVYKTEEGMKIEPEYILKRNGVMGDGEAQSE